MKWKAWKQNFEFYAQMKDYTDETKKKGAFFVLAGQRVQKVFDQLLQKHINGMSAEEFPEGSRLEYTFSFVIELLDKEFVAADNVTVQRTIFKNMTKNVGEPVQSFADRLREQVSFCGHDGVKEAENAVKLQVLEKCGNAELRKQVFLKDRDLDEVLQLASALETADDYEQSLTDGVSSASAGAGSVCAVDQSKIRCYACNRMGHYRSSKECPARGKTCKKCNRQGHFEVCCRSDDSKGKFKGPKSASKRFAPYKKKSSNVRNIAEDDSDPSDYDYVFHLGDGASPMMKVLIGGVEVNACIDSGTKKNLISDRAWEKMKQRKIKVLQQKAESDTTFKAFASEEPINIIGMFQAELVINNITSTPWFYVAEKGNANLIGEISGVHHGVLKVGENVNQVVPFPKFKGEI